MSNASNRSKPTNNSGGSGGGTGGGGGDAKRWVYSLTLLSVRNKTYSIEKVDTKMTVAQFKETLAPLTGVPVAQQSLVYKGQIMRDGDMLSVYNIEDESHMQMATLLLGGPPKRIVDRGIVLSKEADVLTGDSDVPRAKLLCCGAGLTPDSMTDVATESVHTRKRAYVECPNCAKEMDIDFVVDVAMFTSQEKKAFMNQLNQNVVAEMKMTRCPTCKQQGLPPNRQTVRVHCTTCRADFCVKCNRTWTSTSVTSCGNSDCSVATLIASAQMIDIGTEMKNVPQYRCCPKCLAAGSAVPYEHGRKNCKHMICHTCAAHWCFICLRLKGTDAWPPECGGPPLYYKMCPSGVARKQVVPE